MFAVALGLLTACDPCKEEEDLSINNVTSSELLAGATFTQYALVDGSYVEASDGNYIEYNIPAVPSVQIYYVKSSGEESVLAYGSSGGMFTFIPSRGSDSNQTVYFRYINQDQEEIVASKEFTLAVASELSTEVKLLASNDGSKTWKWNTDATDGCVWGNMGYMADSGENMALYGSGKWWGVTSEEEFMGQLNHTDDGLSHGDESMDAYMIFTEDNEIYTYDASGTQIRSGKFAVLNYDPDYSESSYNCGILETTAGSILFPYEINSGGNMPTDFEIAYLTTSRLMLVYPDGGSQGSWGEATFWQFCSTSDITGILTDNDTAAWTWNTEAADGCVWGNMGYQADAAANMFNSGSGKWWGVTSEEEFMGQLNHTDDGLSHGDESMDAYMIFTEDNEIYTYDASGTQIRSGKFAVLNYDPDYSESSYNCGILETTAGSILFPYEINSGGNMPTDFEIAYLTTSRLMLVYPDGGSQGSWGEATFWQFKKK